MFLYFRRNFLLYDGALTIRPSQMALNPFCKEIFKLLSPRYDNFITHAVIMLLQNHLENERSRSVECVKTQSQTHIIIVLGLLRLFNDRKVGYRRNSSKWFQSRPSIDHNWSFRCFKQYRGTWRSRRKTFWRESEAIWHVVLGTFGRKQMPMTLQLLFCKLF